MFSVFYTAVNTFPFLITFLYWLFMNGSESNAFTGDLLHDFVTYSLYAGNSIVAGIEVVFLSDVQRIEVGNAFATVFIN